MALRHCSSSAEKCLGLLDVYLGNGTLFAKTAPFSNPRSCTEDLCKAFFTASSPQKTGSIVERCNVQYLGQRIKLSSSGFDT